MSDKTVTLWCDTANIDALEDSENVCDLKTALYNLLEDVQCLKEEREQATGLIDLQKRQCERMLKDRAEQHERDTHALVTKLDSSQEDYERAMHRVSQLEASEEKLRAELDECVRAWALTKAELAQERERVIRAHNEIKRDVQVFGDEVFVSLKAINNAFSFLSADELRTTNKSGGGDEKG